MKAKEKFFISILEKVHTPNEIKVSKVENSPAS